MTDAAEMELNGSNDLSSKEPIVEACAANEVEDVTQLLAAKANPNESEHGATLLILATSSGFDEIAAALVAHGADVNASDKNKETALHHAAFNGMSETAVLLLEKGANMNARRFNGATPLDCAAGQRMRRVLQQQGALTASEISFREACRQKWRGVRSSRAATALEALKLESESEWIPIDHEVRALWRQLRGFTIFGWDWGGGNTTPRRLTASASRQTPDAQARRRFMVTINFSQRGPSSCLLDSVGAPNFASARGSSLPSSAMRLLWLPIMAQPVWEGNGTPTIVEQDRMSWDECRVLLNRLDVDVPKDLGIQPSDEIYCTVQNFD